MLATKINYMATTHNLLSKNYFKGQCRLYVETEIYYLLEKIYITWNEDKITSLFMINIFAVYLNTSYHYLLQNLHKRNIDVKIIN